MIYNTLTVFRYLLTQEIGFFIGVRFVGFMPFL